MRKSSLAGKELNKGGSIEEATSFLIFRSLGLGQNQEGDWSG